MSSHDIPGGPGGGPGEQISEEELRAYLGEVRAGHVGEVVAQVLSALLNAAQVKLGRRDARLLLDLVAQIAETAGPHLDDRFNREVSNVLSELRLGQVEAERQLADARAAGEDVEEPNDLGTAPTGPPSGAGDRPRTEQPRAEQPSPQQRPSSSRLWVPGQG